MAVLVARFPRIEETFILHEIDELERQGQPLILVPVIGDRQSTVHEEARIWAERALYIPLFNRTIAASNVRCFLQQPKRYLAVLLELIVATILSPRILIRTLGVFPKAVHLSRLLPEMGIRHMHAHAAASATTIAWIAASLSDITYSFTVYGPDVFVHPELLRQKIRDATLVRTVSVFVKAFLAGLHPVVGEGKFRVVHSGVKPEIHESVSTRAGLELSRPQILAVVTSSPATRGVPFLIEACAQLASSKIEFECHIIHSGPLDSVRDLIEHRGLAEHIRLTGAQPQHEVEHRIAEADIFALLSVITPRGQMEGIPLSLVQAMSAGKPVVASALSGIPELVKHGVNGFIVDAAHPERIAAAFLRLLSDPSLRENLGRNARRTVRERFDVRRTVGELVSFFDRQVHAGVVSPTLDQRIAALDWSRLGAAALGIRKVSDRADSSVVEVTITDGISKRDVVVRRHRDSWDGSVSAHQRARAEFEALSVLSQLHGPERADGETWTVPAILMFDEEHASVVMARADGHSLAGMLSEIGPHRSSHRVEEALKKTGRWLAAMQRQTTARGDGRSIIEARRASALADLEIAAAGDFYIGRQFDRIAARLEDLDACLVESAEITGHHGAFAPHNIFVSDRGIEVTDFGRYRQGLPLEDAAHLLLELELALSRSRYRNRIPHMRQLFLDAWAPGERVLQGDLLRFLMTAGALHMLAHADDEQSALASARRRRVLLRMIDRGIGT